MAKKRKKKKKTGLTFSLLTIVIVGVALGLIIYRLAIRSSANGPKTLSVGLIAEQSGEFKTYGHSALLSAQLAVKDINNQGGLKIGSQVYSVKLIAKDNKGSIDTTETEVKDLVDKDKVVAIIGPLTNRFAPAATDVSNSLKVVSISPYSTDPSTTFDIKAQEIKRYAFRASLTYTQEGSLIAKYANDTLKAKTAAIFTDQDDKGAQDELNSFKKAFESQGNKVVDSENFSAGAYDYSKQLINIQNSNPDILFLSANPNQAADIIKQARYLGLKAQIIGTDSWNNPVFLAKCSKDCEGVYLSTHFSADSPNDETKNFVSEFKNSYNSNPDETAALTYDSFGILFQGLINEAATDSQSLRTSISQISDYEGSTGTLKFSTDTNDPTRSITILQIKDGQFTYQTSINP